MRIRLAGQNLHFECAHFIIRKADPDHPPVREPLHGHSYQVAVEFVGPPHNNGYLLDFNPLKGTLKTLCKSWDHRVIVPVLSPHLTITEYSEYSSNSIFGQPVVTPLKRPHTCISASDGDRFVLPTSDLLLLKIPYSSVECLAAEFGRQLLQSLASTPIEHLTDMYVTIDERPEQGATWHHTFD